MLPRLVKRLLWRCDMQQLSILSVKETLISSADSLLERRDEFLTCPETDFTRNRKISFLQTILFPMLAGNQTVDDELLVFFGEEGLPTASSMIERRSQVKPEAFKTLFYEFGSKIHVTKLFHGFQLVACDGSRLNLPYNPKDTDTYIKCIGGRKGINQLHMNSLYDPLNDIFLDVELQKISAMDEKGAFCIFLQRQKLLNPSCRRIYLADRGYAAFNIFAHAIHNDQKILIRVPEKFAKDICKNQDHWLEKESDDKVVTVYIGRRRTAKNQQLPNYHCIPSNGHYDFIEAGSDNTDCLKLRVLKFPVGDNTVEYVVTNLPQHAFSLSAIKKLYHLRWGIETAFRHLKYAGNMVHLHSRKKEFLCQEIYAKLTLYNFSSFVASVVGRERRSGSGSTFRLDFSRVQKICIRFLKGLVADPYDLIRRYLVPVRLGRSFPRNLRRQSADTLNYR